MNEPASLPCDRKETNRHLRSVHFVLSFISLRLSQSMSCNVVVAACFILLAVFGGVFGKFVCNGTEACEWKHLHNARFLNMLSQRCVHRTFFTNNTKNITFTHIPKVGGSTINQVLNRTFGGRYQRQYAHEPFQLSAQLNPDNLFLTVLRDPRDRAVSLYAYINQRKKISQRTARNQMWQNTFGVDPKLWLGNPAVMKRLQLDVLMYFNYQLYNNVMGYNGSAAVVKPFLPPSPITMPREKFLMYTNAMPPEYRCEQHMEVAWLLLRSYAAVGTTEQLPKFMQLVQKRTGNTDPNFLPNATAVHRNPSNYRKVGAENITMIRDALRDKFYCDRVLWKIAGLMTEHDLQC